MATYVIEIGSPYLLFPLMSDIFPDTSTQAAGTDQINHPYYRKYSRRIVYI
jgi:hypothetical protein